MKKRVVIVDDTPLWRMNLRALLSQCEEVEVVGEADTPRRAAKLINELHPDLVFLDIELGGGRSGFDVLPLLQVNPSIVFVTSHAEYALKAFDCRALHYLLKPATLEQLREVIDRLPDVADREDKPYLLKDGKRTQLIQTRDIVAITSSGDYTDVHIREENTYCVHKTLKQWDADLPDQDFVRLDRSIIVRCNDVTGVELNADKQASRILLCNNLSLNVSKTAAKTAEKLLSNPPT
jgi:two-component system LytT family response regulator